MLHGRGVQACMEQSERTESGHRVWMMGWEVVSILFSILKNLPLSSIPTTT